MDRPLAGERFDTAEEFGKHLREYSEGDLARRADAEFSADLGAFMALLSVVGQFPALIATGRLDTRSQVSDVDGWWFGFFSYFASGPPPRRLEELLALHEVGVVSFLGAEMRVDVDNERRLFVAAARVIRVRWRHHVGRGLAAGSQPATGFGRPAALDA